MCGCFTRFFPVETFAELFGARADFVLSPKYNIAPTQAVLASRNALEGSRELVTLHWGLVPPWAKEPKTGYSTINARAETVAEKPAFRKAFRYRRCLIAADGFYEWRRTGGPKQPYYIGLDDGKPFAFAGIWKHWAGQASPDACSKSVMENGRLAMAEKKFVAQM
jgi:putative SOS response-associated peptidase YedK